MREQTAQFIMPGGRMFVWMLALAMVLHVMVLLVVQFMPKADIEEAAVKPIFFRIGGGGALPPAVLPDPETAIKKPPVKAAPDAQKHHTVKKQNASAHEKTQAKPPVHQAVKTKNIVKQATPKDLPSPASKPKPEKEAVEEKTPKRVSITAPVSAVADGPRKQPTENADATIPASVASKPVRSYGLPSLESLFSEVAREAENRDGAAAVEKSTQVKTSLGDVSGNSQNPAANDPKSEEIRLRYEQQISAWVAKHRYYPKQAEGRSGRAVVRVRVDKQGYVRYYKVEETSGYAVFDSAAIDMIRRANPMPAAPENYPAGNLIEFLIPITFKP